MITLLRTAYDWLWHVWLWLLAGLKTAGDPHAAAMALYFINGHIRLENIAPHVKRGVYRFKNVMVRQFYEDGYCLWVDRQYQELECWGDGVQDCWEKCPKCKGTGVYRRVDFHRFYFNIGGQNFCWHQPDDKVDWDIHLPDNPPLVNVASPHIPQRELSARELTYYGYVCWWYLWRRAAAPRLRLFDWLRYLSRWHSKWTRGRYWLGVCYVQTRDAARLSWPTVPDWGLYRMSDWRSFDWIVLRRLGHERWSVQ